jgi:deoxyribonucleoside regulator
MRPDVPFRVRLASTSVRDGFHAGALHASRVDGERSTVSEFEKLVRVSRLYYELGETQGAIAELLGVTRPQVSRLLKQARAEGIVEIRVVDRTETESPAAGELVRRFGLQAVHLAPGISGPEDLTRRMIGRLAAQVFGATVRDRSIVGIGDGAFVSATADAMVDAGTPVSATIVPLCGGYWFTGPGREPFRRIADALGSSVHGLMAPGLVDDPATKASLYAHAGIRAVMALWDRLDIALFGIGSPAWGESSFGPDIFRQLGSSGAVGEVLIAPFDLDGQFGADDLRARTIAFDARDLARVPVTIGVAGGPSKVRPILGALRAGVVKVLVTDVRTAEAVIDLDVETSARATTRDARRATAGVAR